MADRHFKRLLGNVRELFELLDRAGLSSQDLTSTYQYLAAQHPERREAQGYLGGTRGASERWEAGPGRAATCAPCRPRVLRSGELKNHDHQNDDHEDTDDGSDNSPVHGQDLLSSSGGTACCRPKQLASRDRSGCAIYGQLTQFRFAKARAATSRIKSPPIKNGTRAFETSVSSPVRRR